ncbi:hypothetical protein OJ252_2254 [Cryptosporidium canis]|uniref:Uncharacterized protein n=1 Tax=Cryptosporidium canis TaxID=195482 RepID=A0ABQ8P8R8_9CRYT|nr:hypothetical protein OJ252_2254 [Cryptosporidium canis]
MERVKFFGGGRAGRVGGRGGVGGRGRGRGGVGGRGGVDGRGDVDGRGGYDGGGGEEAPGKAGGVEFGGPPQRGKRGGSRGRGGGYYRGGYYSRGGGVFSGYSSDRAQKELDFTRGVQGTAENKEGAGLEVGGEAVGCGNREATNSSGLTESASHAFPEKQNGKDEVVSGIISSTEASECCKSQSSSQNPSPIGGSQEEHGVGSSLHGSSKISAGGGHTKKDRFRNTYKSRSLDNTQHEGALETRRQVVEGENLDSRGAVQACGTTGLGGNEAPTEMSELEKEHLKADECSHAKDPSALESSPTQRSSDGSGPSQACERSLVKPNSQMIEDVINWMFERQKEAIQWLKDNGKYSEEDDTRDLSRRPHRFSHHTGYRGKKHAWNGGREEHHAKRGGYREDGFPSSCPYKASAGSGAPNESDCTAAGVPGKPQHVDASEPISARALNTRPEQEPGSRPRQRFEYNRKLDGAKGGNLQLQTKIKEGEAVHSAEARHNPRFGEKNYSRNGGFDSPRRYRGYHYKKPSAPKEL